MFLSWGNKSAQEGSVHPVAEQLLISVVHALGASFLLTQELSVDEESARRGAIGGYPP